MKKNNIKSLIIFVFLALCPGNLLMAQDSANLANEGSISINKTSSSMMDVLDLKKMDVQDVLKLISQKSGMNIVAGPNVSGKVTIYLKNVSVLDALKIIVEAYDWAYMQEDGVLKVMTARDYETKYGHKFGQDLQTKIRPLSYAKAADVLAIIFQIKGASGKVISDEKSNTLILMDSADKLEEMEGIINKIDVPVSTQVFDLSYAKAEDLSKNITELLTPTVGMMKFDDRSNKILVSDTPQKLQNITKLIDAFDQKDRQVLIEAKIVQIVLSDAYKLGVDWEAMVENYRKLNLVGNFDVLSSSDKFGKLSIGTVGDGKYNMIIEALDSVGTTNVLSSPRITSINNKEAKILVGSTEPYVTSTTTTPASGPTTTAETVNFIEVGVKLFVTPTIHKDDFITMKIKPEISSVLSKLTTGSNNKIPIVETSEAETTVTVKDGVTIVIGGLIKDEKIKNVEKVPLLGSIPMLGAAFRNTTDSVKKTEIAIFLTPKIVMGDQSESSLAATSSSEDKANLK